MVVTNELKYRYLYKINCMKKLLFFVLLLSGQVMSAQKLKFIVYNRTGYDLDSIYIGRVCIGSIKKDDSLLVSNIGEFTMQDGMPFGFPSGSIKGKRPDRRVIGLCGTGVHPVNEGVYRYDIMIGESENGYGLYWEYHK
jgi:hypothetical protein